MVKREAQLVRTFVEVADTLVADFDVVELLTSLAHHCVELFDASEAGLLLADRDGGLQVVASSSTAMSDLELFELQHDEGPCIDCFRTGRVVVADDLEADRARWPGSSPRRSGAGFRAGLGAADAAPRLHHRVAEPPAHASRVRSRTPTSRRRRRSPTSRRSGSSSSGPPRTRACSPSSSRTRSTAGS